jgi:hypothetical protein
MEQRTGAGQRAWVGCCQHSPAWDSQSGDGDVQCFSLSVPPQSNLNSGFEKQTTQNTLGKQSLFLLISAIDLTWVMVVAKKTPTETL